MLSRSALSRLCIVGASHGRKALASRAAAPGAEAFLSQQASVAGDGSAASFADNRIRSRSSSSSSRSWNYEPSRFDVDFKFIDLLGRGSFGIVCAAVNRIDMQMYAVKCIPFATKSLDVFNEARSMAYLPPHTNVIRYFSSWVESTTNTINRYFLDGTESGRSGSLTSSCGSRMAAAADAQHVLYIQMEHCHGSLRSWLQNRTEVDPLAAIRVFRQMIRGLKHLHDNGVLHLDVKPENCLHIHEQVFKIGDFGSSRISGEPQCHRQACVQHDIGTESYAAPECKRALNCSAKSDVYSLGLCLMELFVTFHTGMERVLAFDDVRRRLFTQRWTSRWTNVAIIVKAMTMESPDDRPSLEYLCEWSGSFTDPNPMTLQIETSAEQSVRDGITMGRSIAQF